MAVKEEFEIVIDKEGALRAMAKGFSGRECEIPLKRLIEMLGIETGIQFNDEYRRASECTDIETKVKDK
jgi:hypothetical protein